MLTFKGLFHSICAGGALIALAACAPAPSQPGSAATAAERLDRAPGALRSTTVELPSGTVRVGVPRGTCVAPQSTQINEQGAVVVAGDCAAVVRNPQNEAEPVALLTATVSEAPLPGAGTTLDRVMSIEDVLHGDFGEGLLGVQDETARLVETRLHNDTVYALVDTGASTAFAGAAPLMWRAISQERGHMIVLSAYTMRQDMGGIQALLEQIRAFREATRQVNRTR